VSPAIRAWPPAGRFVAAGGVMIVGGGIMAAVNSAATFAAGVQGAPAGAARAGYRVLIAGLAISVLVGSTLGDAAPADWLL
jgi:hypothetical protein